MLNGCIYFDPDRDPKSNIPLEELQQDQPMLKCKQLYDKQEEIWQRIQALVYPEYSDKLLLELIEEYCQVQAEVIEYLLSDTNSDW